MKAEAITLLLKEASDAFPPIDGKPTDDDLLAIWEVLLPILLFITEWPILNSGGGVHGLEYEDGHLWMASHRFTQLLKVDVWDGKFQPVHDILVNGRETKLSASIASYHGGNKRVAYISRGFRPNMDSERFDIAWRTWNSSQT